MSSEKCHLIRNGRTVCGLTEWTEGNVDIEFGLKNTTTCVPCLRKIALELMNTRTPQQAETQEGAVVMRACDAAQRVLDSLGVGHLRIKGTVWGTRMMTAALAVANAERDNERCALLKDCSDGFTIALFPSMPGCVSQGTGDADALRNLADAIDSINEVRSRIPASGTSERGEQEP